MALPLPPSVLVVDDDPDVVALVSLVLQDQGYRVRCAYNGRTALAAVEDHPPDVLVSDILMPEMDGANLVIRLRQEGIAVPVVLMSAAYDGVDLPGISFIRKPFDIDRFVSVVERALAA